MRDSGYWQDLPKVKELRYTSYTDNNAQTTALANGESEWSFVFIPNYKTVFIDKDPANHKVWAPAGAGHPRPVHQHHQGKPFDNPALRRAMNMVINRDDIFNTGRGRLLPPAGEQRDRSAQPRPATRSSRRSTRARTTRSTSRAPRRCSPAPASSSTATR